MLSNSLIFCVFAFISVTSAAPADTEAASAQSAYLDPEEKFHLEWSFSDDDITFKMTVNTTGWFGLGFSENGGMAGADIIVAGVKEGGEAYLWDMHAVSKSKPRLDDKQNVELISGHECDGQTKVTFKRKHFTCDTEHDRPIGEDTMRLIFAMSPSNSDELLYHTGFRGARSIYLRRSIAPINPATPEDAITIEIHSTNVEIPSDKDTLYVCELIKTPQLSTKHHLIQVDPLIKKENLGLVHHMILYGCYDDIDREEWFANNNTVHDCTGNPNMPDVINMCRVPVTLWAIGGGSYYFPEEAGLPFGDENSPKYLMMEVHYDNPQMLSGRFDDSGMRLTLTPTLRPNDAGVLPVGSIPGINIPPGVKDFRVTGFCPGDCSAAALTEPINVFGAFLHGHLAARGIITRHFRNGTELDVLDKDFNYDFNYQQYREFATHKQILPGDDLMVTCHYNTQDRANMTYGGLPSSSEMCITYLSYFPAQEIGDCFTMPSYMGDPTWLIVDLGLPYVSNKSDELLNHATEQNLWTEDRVNELQEAYLNVDHYQLCYDRARKYLHDTFRTYIVPNATKTPAPREQPQIVECEKQNVVEGGTNDQDGGKGRNTATKMSLAGVVSSIFIAATMSFIMKL